MKRTLLIVVLIGTLSGCMPRLSSPVQVFEGRVATTFDFTPYLDSDFVFTAGAYDGTYEPRGFISLTLSPRTTDMLRVNAQQVEGWTDEQSRVEPLLEKMYQRALDLDADGVSHFAVEIERADLGKAVYRISGLAIRRQ